MPIMAGDEMAREFRRRRSLRSIPLMVITGSGWVPEDGLFDRVELKPMDPREALRAVRELLRR
jgi:CheY-like chemotaxis protein